MKTKTFTQFMAQKQTFYDGLKEVMDYIAELDPETMIELHDPISSADHEDHLVYQEIWERDGEETLSARDAFGHLLHWFMQGEMDEAWFDRVSGHAKFLVIQ